MAIGTLTVEVVKATGNGLKGAGKVRCTLSVGVDKKSTAFHRMARISSNVKFNETLTFDVDQPSDHLTIIMEKVTKEYPNGGQMGRQSVALAHLPNGRQISKWYQVTNQAVLLLKMEYHISYSNVEELGMTVFPASDAQLETFFPQNPVKVGDVAQHLVDYVAMLGCNLEQLMQMSVLPSDELLEKMGLLPKVIERYPKEDNKTFPLPEQLPLFCFPEGYKVKHCAGTHDPPPAPTWRCFQLNDGNFPVHGASIIFWRLFRHPTHTLVWLPQCLCLLSHYAFYPQFKIVLEHFYTHYCKHTPERTLHVHMSAMMADEEENGSSDDDEAKLQLAWKDKRNGKKKSQSKTKSQSKSKLRSSDETGVSPQSSEKQRIAMLMDVDNVMLSMEQYVVMLCHEVPLPVAGRMGVVFPLGANRVHTGLPHAELDFPHLELSLQRLFQILDLDIILRTVSCLLTEGQWEHVFIPVLPKALSSVLQAPVPFLVGLDSHAMTKELEDHLDEHSVAVLDLDACRLHCSMPIPEFPALQTLELRTTILRLCRPSLFSADVISEPEADYDDDDDDDGGDDGGGDDGGDDDKEEYDQEEARKPTSSTRFNGGEGVPIDTSEGHVCPGQGIWAVCDDDVQYRIRYAFLKFIAHVLQGYRNYVFFVNGQKPTFNTVAFLQHRMDARHFLSRFAETQLFTIFLDKHVESPSYLQDLVVYMDADAVSVEQRRLKPDFFVNYPPALDASILRQRYDQGINAGTKKKKNKKIKNHDVVQDHSSPIQGKWYLLKDERFTPPRPLKAPSVTPYGCAPTTFDFNSTSVPDSETKEEEEEDEKEEKVMPGTHSRTPSQRLVLKSTIEKNKPPHLSRLHRAVIPLLASGASLARVRVRVSVRGQEQERQPSSTDQEVQARGQGEQKTTSDMSSDGDHMSPPKQRRSSVVPTSPNDSDDDTTKFSHVATEGIDVGELTAVGELLKFRSWRTVLVDICKERKVHMEETELSHAGFTALALLFNIGLQEAGSDNDFCNAKSLLEISGKLFQSLDSQGGDRDYLCYAVKQHKLWKDERFWGYSLETEFNRQWAELQASNEDKDEEDKDHIEREEFFFDVMGKFIYTILSMDIDIVFVQTFIHSQCTKFNVSDLHMATLTKLASNIHMAKNK